MAVTPQSKYWERRSVGRLDESEKNSEVYIERVNKIYDKAKRDIQDQINNVYKNYSNQTGIDTQKLKELLTKKETDAYWKTLEGAGLKQYVRENYKARITRLEKIKGQIYARAKEIAVPENAEHTKSHVKTIQDTYNKVMYDTGQGTGFDFSFNQMDTRGVEQILQTRWIGKNYSERIWGNTDILADKLSIILGGAVASGQSSAKTIREMQQAFGVSKYYAERLIRTETNHFNNEAEAEAYNELGVEKYVFMATLDSRTSAICQDHDNKIYDLKDKAVGINYPPLHANCRSTVRAYLGKDYEPIKRRARNPETGKNEIIDNMSYDEWAKLKNIKPVTVNPTNPIPEPKTEKKRPPKIDFKPLKNEGVYNNTPQKVAKIVKPSVRGVDSHVVDILNEGTQDVASKYPQAFDNLQKVAYNKVTDLSKNPEGVVAMGYRYSPINADHSLGKFEFSEELKISIRERYNNADMFKDYNTLAYERKNYSTGNQKHVVHHEYAHVLAHNMNIAHHNIQEQFTKMIEDNGKVISMERFRSHESTYNKLKNTTLIDGIVDDTVNDYIKITGADPRSYTITKEKISRYGSTSKSEAFAELFAKVMNNDQDDMTKIFKNKLDNKLKELKML